MAAQPAAVRRTRPLPELSYRAKDPDEAREVGSRLYHPHGVTVLGDPASFAVALDAVSLGPLALGWLTYHTKVRLDSTHPGYYQVNLPIADSLVATCGGREVTAGPGSGVIHVPDRPAAFTAWSTPAPLLTLRIDRTALEHELERLLDRPVRDTIDVDLHLDLSSGRGAQWLALVRSLAADLSDGDSLVRQPMIAAPFTHSVLAGLLLIALPDARDELAAPTPAVGSSVVRHARDYIEANADQPLTVADIARAVGVGVRGLQQGFHRSLDTSPTDYLRHVRLRRVHRELLIADPATTTVRQLAARWGFPHAGRFAAQYRQRYGEPPGDTLRRRG